MSDIRIDEVTAAVNEILAELGKSSGLISDMPQSCVGRVVPWDNVMRGQITAEIEVAHKYIFDSHNDEGTFAERREKLNEIVRVCFTKFVTERKREYESVRCHYFGTQRTHDGTKTTTITCAGGFVFLKDSLVHSQHGGWKGGPFWENGYTQMSWRTGGNATTVVDVDAVYADILGQVLRELNTARAVLHEKGIPTELPSHLFNQD